MVADRQPKVDTSTANETTLPPPAPKSAVAAVSAIRRVAVISSMVRARK